MKKYAILLTATLLFISCGKSESEKAIDSKYKRYEVKSGIVKYKTTITGKVMGSVISGEGKSSLYFKDYGALELKEEESEQTTEMKIFGQKKTDKTNEHSITKMDKGIVYTVDFKNKKINKIENIGMALMQNTDMNKVGKQMLETMGGKELGTEKFMGYECEIWDMNGAKQYFYKGIPLRSEIKMMGITTITEATSVKFDTKVSDSKFNLPDFEIVELENMMGGESIDKIMNSADFQDDMEDVKENMDALSKMSFKEWKKFAQESDPEMAKMNDKELRETYDLIQQMIKLRTNK